MVNIIKIFTKFQNKINFGLKVGGGIYKIPVSDAPVFF